MQCVVVKKPYHPAVFRVESGQTATKTGNSDLVTGLYYYGARYLDPKTSRWLSGDPVMGEYVPLAPINDDAKKHNKNLPGMGGVFNVINMHCFAYAGNNPIKLTDPNGKWLEFDGDTITCDLNAKDLQQAKEFMNEQYRRGETQYTKVIARNRENGNEIYFSDREKLMQFVGMLDKPLNYSGIITDIAYIAKYVDKGKMIADGSLAGKIGGKLGIIATGVDFINFLNDPNWDSGTDLAFTFIGNFGITGMAASYTLQGGKLAIVGAAKLMTEVTDRVQYNMMNDCARYGLGVNLRELGFRSR